MKTSIGVVSYAILKVVELLRSVAVGTVVSYEELSKLVGGNIQRERRYALSSAKRILLREGIYFDCILNVGVKRCNDHEMIDAAGALIPKIRRITKKATKIATSVDYDALTKEDKVRHNIFVSQHAFLASVTSDEATKTLSSQVVARETKLSLQETLEAFRGK